MMKEEHPVSRIARLVYDRQDADVALAAELRISPEELAQWLAGELAPRTRLLMKDFAAAVERLSLRFKRLLDPNWTQGDSGWEPSAVRNALQSTG
jgi:hypothetical protein